jgi:hypothetical protein
MNIETNHSIIETEIKEIFTTYRSQHTLLTQLVTVFIIANVTVVGFVLKNDNVELLFLGAIFPILIIIVRIKTNQLMTPIIYSGISLESKFNVEMDWVISTYTELTYPKSYLKIKEILKIEEKSIRILELKKMNSGIRMIFTKNNFTVTIISILAAIIQLLIPIC